MEKIGIESKAAAQIAAHVTRDKKQIAGPEATLAAHQRLAAQFGNQPQQVVAAARECAEQIQHAEKKSPAQLALEALNFARNRLYEREAVVDERRLFRDALRRGMGEVCPTPKCGSLSSRGWHRESSWPLIRLRAIRPVRSPRLG